MKTRFLLTIMVLGGCLAFMSCKDNKSDKKENTEQSAADKKKAEQEALKKAVQEAIEKDGIVLQGGDETIGAQKNGEAYTGEVWSLDKRSFVMNFKDGQPVNSITYHKNGKIAIMADSEKGTETYYDEEGNEMEGDAFLKQYEKYIDEIGPQMESVFERMQ